MSTKRIDERTEDGYSTEYFLGSFSNHKIFLTKKILCTKINNPLRDSKGFIVKCQSLKLQSF